MEANLHPSLSLLVASSVLLAGCTGGGDGPPPADEPVDFSNLELEATETTGVIRGVVVDDAIRPLANATVTLVSDGDRTATTTDSGTFGFEQVPPGTHFLTVSRFRYLDQQQSVDV